MFLHIVRFETWNSSCLDEGLVIVASFDAGSLLQSLPEITTSRQKKKMLS